MTVPEGWQAKRFDELGTLWSGATPSSNTSEFWDGDIVWITPTDLSRLNTPYIHDSAKRITERGLAGCSTNLLPAGSIVLSSRAPIGYIAIPTTAFCTNQGCKSIELGDAFNSEFVYYAVSFIAGDVKRLGEGTTFAEISKKALAGVELIAPDCRVEQSKIAEVLSTVDSAIAQTEALIAKQQRIKTGLMQDLLTRGIDEHGQLRSEATHTFKDSSLGRIPVEWEVTALEEVADVSGGKRLPAGHSYAEGKTGFVYLRVLDFYNREIDVDSLVSLEGDTFQTLQRYEIRDGELCISIAGSLGYVSVLRLRTDMRAILTENALRIVPGSEIDADYLCMAMNGLAVQTQVEALKGTGGGVPKLALHRVKSLSVAFPKDKMEQERIIGIMTAHAKNALKVNKTLHKLQRLKTALMQDLLSGKVRVTPLLQAAEETASA